MRRRQGVSKHRFAITGGLLLLLVCGGVALACGGGDDEGSAPFVTPPGPADAAIVPKDPPPDAAPTVRVHTAGTCGAVQRSTRYGSTANDEVLRGFALDPQGNALATGYVRQALSGDASAAGAADAASDASFKNAFLFFSRYDSTGTQTLNSNFGDDSTSSLFFLGRAPSTVGYAVATDPQMGGGTILVGGLAGGADFGGGVISSADSWRNFADAGLEPDADASSPSSSFATSCSECNRDIVILRRDANGNHVSSKRYGGVGDDNALGVAFVPNSTDFVVVGSFFGSLDFGIANEPPLQAASADFTDAFVVRFDGSSGNALWAKRFGGASRDEATQVAVDPAGNIYVAGFFTKTASFGGAVDLTTPASSEGDAFVVKLDSQGKHVWSGQLGASIAADARGLAVDASGNVAFSGTFKGVVKYATGSAFQSATTNAFVAKIDATGKPLFARGWGGMYGGWGSRVVFTPDGGLVAVGGVDAYGKLRIDFGGGWVDPVDEHDVYVVELGKAGEHLCSRRFGGGGGRYNPLVAIDGANTTITVATSFERAVDLGKGNVTNAGDLDLLVATMARSGK